MGEYFNSHKLGACNYLMYITLEELELFAGVYKWIQGGGLLASLISGSDVVALPFSPMRAETMVAAISSHPPYYRRGCAAAPECPSACLGCDPFSAA